MHRLSHRSLFNIVCLLAVAAITIVATYLLSMRLGLATLQLKADQRAVAVTSTLFLPVEKFRFMPTVLSSHSAITAALSEPGNARLAHLGDQYLSSLNSKIGAEMIYLIDQNGKTIASSNWDQPSSFVGHNFKFRPYFEDAIRGKEGRFYGMGTVSRSPGYYISYPVAVADKVLGVVAMKINLANLDLEWKSDSSYDIAVADEFGIVFLTSHPEWKYRPFKALSQAELKQLTSTRKYDANLRAPLRIDEQSLSYSPVKVSRISDRDDGGKTSEPVGYVVRQQKLPAAGWSVSVFMQTAPVQAQALRNAFVTAAIVAFLSLVALYWREQRKRVAAQEKSRKIIDAAHAELAERHQQLEKLTLELQRIAITDPGLGCYNRRFFMEQVAKLAASANRHKLSMSIAIVDIDHFKSVNDTYGHLTGDMVLQGLVDVCRATLRDEDIFARFGGEEFIVALMHATSDEALRAAERLRKAVSSEMYCHEATRFSITISCGVAQYDACDTGIEGAIRRADEALYTAKNGGRNRVVVAGATG